MAEINIFFLVISSIGLDLLIGDPLFLIHPVQIMGFFIKESSNFFIHLSRKKESILTFSGLIIALITIIVSYSLGKILEILFFKINNIFFGFLILFGLSSCLATRSLISSVKEISCLLNKKLIDQKTSKIIISKVQKIVSRDVTTSSPED